ncbi:MAG: hypothetical protein IKZ97_00610 [Butyrivibrio sp.]|nr:hypothetical protein [Butyrivibrio sp.]
MLNQKVLLVLLIISLIAVLGMVIWRAIYATKNKGDENAQNALAKAKAVSSYTLWLWLICWGGFSTFIFKADTVFTLSNIGTFIVILIGMQSIVELMAGYYFTKCSKVD